VTRNYVQKGICMYSLTLTAVYKQDVDQLQVSGVDGQDERFWTMT
jgi:hypothetical protein